MIYSVFFRRAAVVCGAAAALLGLLGLLGWLPGLRSLASLRPDFIPMAPSTAVAFLWLGSILSAHARWRWRGRGAAFAGASAALVSIFGLLKALEYFVGVPLTWEDTLVPIAGQFGSVPLARMSPATGGAFFLAGIATLLLVLRPGRAESAGRWGHWAGSLGSVVVAVSLTFLLGYLYGTPLLYGSGVIPMAATTAAAFLLFGAALIAVAGPASFPARSFLGYTTRARLWRSFLPWAALLIVALELWHTFAPESREANGALLAAATTIFFLSVAAIVIALAARSMGDDIDRAEAERNRAHAALRASEARYRTLFDGVPVGIYRSTPTGEIIDGNLALAQMLGYPDRESLLAVNAADLYADAAERQQWQAVIERDHVMRGFQARLRRRDGATIWVEDNARVVHDARGQALYYEGNLTDVTGRKQVEAAEREQRRLSERREAELATLLHAAQAVSSSQDVDQVLVQIARSMTHALQMERCTLSIYDAGANAVRTQAEYAVEGVPEIGDLGNLYSLSDYPATARVLETGEARILRADDPAADAAEVSLLREYGDAVVLMIPLCTQGRAVGLAEPCTRDSQREFTADELRLAVALAEQAAVTIENARLYEALRDTNTVLEEAVLRANELAVAAEEASRLKSEFLANTSHELRSPLAGIQGALSLVLAGLCDDPQEERKFIGIAFDSSRHLLNVVNDLLDLAKIEAGRMEMCPQAVDVAASLAETYTLSEVQAQAKGLELVASPPPPDLPLALADADRLRQILFNLVGNAVKFTERGRITLSASLDGPGRIKIAVQDTGIGIPPEKQAGLFQSFVQVDGGTTRRYGGAGLGLAISRRLAEMMDGTLTLYSAGAGQGSTFTLTLPLAGGRD